MLVTGTTDRLIAPSIAERQAILDGPVTQEAFQHAIDVSAALHAVEVPIESSLPKSVPVEPTLWPKTS